MFFILFGFSYIINISFFFINRLEVKGCVEDTVLDDGVSSPMGFSHQNTLREVILTWDGKSESIEFMAGVVRDQPAHPRREEFRSILEYYR